MSNVKKITRGLDLCIAGGVAQGAVATEVKAGVVAICPDDFPGFIPKLVVREGDPVYAGQPLMHDKVFESVNIVSPISGVVKAVVRGERRKILRVEVEATDASVSAPAGSKPDLKNAGDICGALAASGLLAMMRQRPYDILPRPGVVPVNIFVTAFDSAPLATSLEDAVKGMNAEIAAGADLLSKVTSGKVYISTRNDSSIEIPASATHIIIEGPHPAGNTGVQAANIAPVNKGEVIWTLDIVTLARIGRYVMTGAADWSTVVAVTGSEVKEPKLVKTSIGAAVAPLLAGELDNNGRHERIIAGNVLSGVKIDADGYLRYPYRQITVIPEGDDVDEFMGWASMSPKKMSQNRSFISSLLKGKKFRPDARINGGRRAMIMSEQYDRMMPMDILPEYLIKAIIGRDIDQMERLGIYEVAPEDFALAEYADPSKIELQKIVREGLDYLRKETE